MLMGAPEDLNSLHFSNILSIYTSILFSKKKKFLVTGGCGFGFGFYRKDLNDSKKAV